MTTQLQKRYQEAKKNIQKKMNLKVDALNVEKQKEKRYNLLKNIS